ncbi:conserved hypothetical protein [Bradyrhizobium oligotrophicum S58]|uniref:D-alanyl-D-alanine dipeptidase n=1 Tax=Bradyrhizobium oligotrophicum S58 TaxID=1245469 RepID=M4ZSK6_9BRAD|nr:M15 family metallopeptidase [Bradyrhizobium oligotrophicum]BAM89240.1 conserved hypothetical protein [Bradyrhizobium oligotrophicum S58]
MSWAERPSIPSKCRCPRTNVDFGEVAIKARAIGAVSPRGKAESPGSELSPVPSRGCRRPARWRSTAAGSLLRWAILLVGIVPASAAPLPADFVYLRDIDATIQQDIRYAGSNNFVGRPLPGYEAAECIVTRGIALRLKAAQAQLRPRGLSLKMLDCYRPVRAVAEMLAWSEDGVETAAGRRYTPGVAKRDLFRLGYIAVRSGHSTGAAVDLTLVELAADNSADFDPAKDYADCTAPAALRAPEGSVDMGTGYDCSDPKAHTSAQDLRPEQRRWRSELVAVMAAQGFVNYAREWWHFSLPGAGETTYVFRIRPRR